MIDQEKINNFIINLRDTIQRLDTEEEQIKDNLEKGVFKDLETINQKQSIRKTYLQKIFDYYYVLKQLESTDKIIEKIWEKRKNQFTDNYNDLL